MKSEVYLINKEQKEEFINKKKYLIELLKKEDSLKEELENKLMKYSNLQEKNIKHTENVKILNIKISNCKKYINNIRNQNTLKEFSIRNKNQIKDNYEYLIKESNTLLNNTKNETSILRDKYRNLTIKNMDILENKIKEVINYFKIKKETSDYGYIYDIKFPFNGEFDDKDTENIFIQYVITIIKIISKYVKSYILFKKLEEMYSYNHNFTLNDIYELLQILFKDNDKDNKNKLELITMFNILPSIYGTYNNQELLCYK